MSKSFCRCLCRSTIRRFRTPLLVLLTLTAHAFAQVDEVSESEVRVYENQFNPIENPQPILGDYPEFVQPVVETRRFEAPMLVKDADADLEVRAWRFSYNARGIIEMPNRLRADQTAVIVVHPWGIDDGQGWRTPEPAGAADFCTPEKNDLAGRHLREVVDPLLTRLRPHVALVMYSLRGKEYPVHRQAYRSMTNNPTALKGLLAARKCARF